MAKPIFLPIIISLAVCAVLSTASAETVTATATMQAAAANVFSIEFYTDSNVLYSTTIPFTNINPVRSYCYADRRTENDGKSDTGILCRTNMNITWYLKMGASSSTFPLAKFKYYMGQPWNRTRNMFADGTLANESEWYSVPTSTVRVYTAGPYDKNNLSYGTLATLSFAIDPSGIQGGTSYIITITYTLTATP